MRQYIILFDGVCNFCNFWINFIIKRDRQNKFLFAPLQSEKGQEYLKIFNLDHEKFTSFILISGSDYYQKSEAALVIAKNLPFPSKLLYILKIFPKSLLDKIYSFIAKNRYKWFGRREFCRIAGPRERSKFLT